jgi:methylated-DNA-protein-cysteine methyltransferase-like protein
VTSDEPRRASFAAKVYDLVRRCPRGKIVSYGGVAALLGRPRAARGVGRALFELPDGSDVPWWRVVNRNGEISIKGVIHGPQRQRALLEREGVRFNARGRIDWRTFGWNGRAEDNEGRGGRKREAGKTKRSGRGVRAR